MQALADKDATINTLTSKNAILTNDNATLTDDIADLGKQVVELTDAHLPCPNRIAGLRRQLVDVAAAVQTDETALQKSKEEMEVLLESLGSAASSSDSEDDKRVFAESIISIADMVKDFCDLKREHETCPAIIAVLRKQIKETNEALELDDESLEKDKDLRVLHCLELENKFRSSVSKLAATAAAAAAMSPAPVKAKKTGRVKLGAGAAVNTARLALPLPCSREEAAVEDKKLEAGTFTGIAHLRKELADIKKAHAPCGDIFKDHEKCPPIIAGLTKKVKELEEALATTTKELADIKKAHEDVKKEHEKCPPVIAGLKIKLKEVEDTLATTTKELAAIQKAHTPCADALAAKDADIADLKKRLTLMEHAHSSCPSIIAALRTHLKDTKEALSKDEDALDKCKDEMQALIKSLGNAMSAASVGKKDKKKGSKAGGGENKVGAAAGPDDNQTKEDEDVKMFAETISGIADLMKEVCQLRRAHAPCDDIKKEHGKCPLVIAGLNQKIKELDEALATTTKELSDIQKAHAKCGDMKKEHEKCPPVIAGLNKKVKELDEALATTTKELAEMKKTHAPCADALATKDTDIADLKQRLAAAEKKHAPCQDIIASLRKQLDDLSKAHAPCPNIIATLQTELEALTAAHTPCDAQIKELKRNLAELDEDFKALQQKLKEERELLPFFPFFLGPLLAQDKENSKALRSNLDKGSKERVRLGSQASAHATPPSTLFAPPKGLCGVGMLLELDQEYSQKGDCVVTRMVPDLPAALCGHIRKFDLLYKVDDTYIAGYDLDAVRALIIGLDDTPVTLEFSRPSHGGITFKLTLHRNGGVPPLLPSNSNVVQTSRSNKSAISHDGQSEPVVFNSFDVFGLFGSQRRQIVI